MLYRSENMLMLLEIMGIDEVIQGKNWNEKSKRSGMEPLVIPPLNLQRSQ